MCTAGRRPPTDQLATPPNGAGLLRFTSGLQHYSDAIVLAVVRRVCRRRSAARASGRVCKWWMLTFVMITLDAGPPTPAPTHEIAGLRIARCTVLGVARYRYR